eukprot:GFUD01034317.1.p1 GENE.GFUD01034317.1~~GFUD01034317.1.p1  ORF type:complete len:375 (-),score=78.36 GFUD01034317.1:135-1259(-)
MDQVLSTKDSWYIEWAWVGGYSSLSTLVFIFNILIFFSVGKNKFLHYSFHYIIVALSLRNLLRVILTLCLVFLAKLIQTPWLLEATFLIPANTSTDGIDLTQTASMSLTCEVLSMWDHILMTAMMFYMAGMSLYMFCRHPNPSITEVSETTFKLSSIVPVKERSWVSPLLLLLPPLLAALLCLPIPLLHETHPMIALPGGSVCNLPDSAKFNTYQSSVAILGFLLPSAIVFCLMIGLSIRRCISCSGGTCVSSFCKEEMSLALLTLPYLAAYLAMYLPLLDHYLQKLDLPQTGVQPYITPEIARAVEMVLGLLLPVVVYSVLPGYRRFSSEPDASDLRRSKKESYNQSVTAPDSTRLSQESLELALVTRNGYTS